MLFFSFRLCKFQFKLNFTCYSRTKFILHQHNEALEFSTYIGEEYSVALLQFAFSLCVLDAILIFLSCSFFRFVWIFHFATIIIVCTLQFTLEFITMRFAFDSYYWTWMLDTVIMKVSMSIPLISLIKHIYHRCACYKNVTFFFFNAYTRHTAHCRPDYLLHHMINHHINSIWA